MKAVLHWKQTADLGRVAYQAPKTTVRAGDNPPAADSAVSGPGVARFGPVTRSHWSLVGAGPARLRDSAVSGPAVAGLGPVTPE